MPRNSGRRLLAALSLCLLQACSARFASGTDAGWMSVPPDAGATMSPVDAGSPMIDAGTPDDGGSVADAGTPIRLKTLTPPLGPASGGTHIVILGSGFAAGFAATGGTMANAQTSVFFGTTQLPIDTSVSIIDDTRMLVVSPPGVAGKTDVTVTIGSQTDTCSKCFEYVSDITLTRLSSTAGTTLGGDAITIFGSGFAPGMLVLVGGSEATGVQVSPDGTQIQCVTPPGTAGSADVGVIGPNAAGWLRRGFVYYAPVRVVGVNPAASPLAGGETVTITGSGFTPDAQATIGGTPATTTWLSESELMAVVPAGSAAGVAPVAVSNIGGSATLPNGFVYYDTTQTLRVYAVVPWQGSIAGGVGALVLGSGLSIGDGLQLTFGANPATVLGGNANEITVTIPPAQTTGLVDVTATTVHGGSFSLPQGFAYVSPLTVTSLSPGSGPAMNSTPATVNGTGFSASCQVFVGANQATVTGASVDGTSLDIVVPPGSSGARDIHVICGAGTAAFQQTALPGGFTYTAPLNLLNIAPNTGAIAGNTAVTLYGSGFTPDMQVLFGTAAATGIQVQSANVAIVRTPPGNVGYVDVTVQAGGEASTLPQSFGYYNPANTLGGGSGGPMQGILNVTVLNVTYGSSGPLAGATVSINADQLVGTTDARGQVTFSDPSLLKPVSITASMSGFTTNTIAQINARNVTVFVSGVPPACPPGQCDQPPPPPATISGRICGFKLPQGASVPTGHHVEARLYTTFPYVYAAPPFGSLPPPIRVKTDCGSFKFQTTNFGRFGLWAEFGIASDQGSEFQPFLMGVVRGVSANPGMTTSGIDVILSMHLDRSLPITIDESLLGLGGTQAIMNQVYSYLDLGGEGVVPLGSAQSTDAQFTFTNHPDIEGQGLVFLNVATLYDTSTSTQSPPWSYCFRRQYGDLSAGVTIGPMLAFTQWVSPSAVDAFSATLSWQFLGGAAASVQELGVSNISTGQQAWQVILPGDAESVTIPPSAASAFPAGASFQWFLITADSPRFDYNTFTFDQLGINDWTSFTENYGVFPGPPGPTPVP